MRLATLRNGRPDGQLVAVSQDGARCLPLADGTLLGAVEQWAITAPRLGELADRLESGEGDPLDPALLMAPLPRTWQWLDGSAYPQHGELMQRAFGLPPIDSERPLMYQGLSDRFYGPNDPIPFPSEDDGIDFEGEFGVIVDAVRMGTSAAEALDHIRLIVQINDWSLRTIAPIEMKTGFGWVQAKPPCSMAPFAVTPDMLGKNWRDGRVHGRLASWIDGERFGDVPSGPEMAFGFHELIAHAARTRDLVAGTVIGSGTVSSRDYASVGSSCLSERRAIDVIEARQPTPFLHFGQQVKMTGIVSDTMPFGIIEQVVMATGAAA
ncbi:fumarylacetoacetate hydrolase family protein [Novosphingobium sp. 9]|uniref:fumarylacetoacetate hydrolase family protein n=1 Tax=Novosphingobium sp. 9 TaxID=2025349 RepID=UPI0021B5368A|nr:fumarylacetoacetate hydrolase family protein [Novosphingobium sp. 9]